MSLSIETISQLITLFKQEIIAQKLTLDDSNYPVFKKGLLETAKKLSQKLQSFTTLLESLTSEVKWELGDLNEKIETSQLHYGLNDIPDDVLSDIIVKDCLDSVYDLKVDRSHELQLTCKRFKAVLQATPECWSRITRLTRGANLDQRLQLRLKFDVVVDRETRADLVTKYADRIGSLECKENTPSEWYGRDWEFPSVKSLVIHGNGILSRNWILPQLTCLECNRVPSFGLFPAVRHCVLKTCYREDETSPLKVIDNNVNIARFLITMPLLRFLSLSVNNDLTLPENHPTITLRHLRHLVLTNYMEDLFASKLLRLLDLPQLESIHLIDDKKASIRFTRTFSSVKTLVLDSPDWYRELNLTCLHSAFPSLQRIEFSAMLIIDDSNNSEPIIQNGPILDLLKTVSYSETYTTSQVIKSLEWYKNNGAGLDRVEVKGWTMLNKFDIRELEEKVSAIFPQVVLHFA